MEWKQWWQPWNTAMSVPADAHVGKERPPYASMSGPIEPI